MNELLFILIIFLIVAGGVITSIFFIKREIRSWREGKDDNLILTQISEKMGQQIQMQEFLKNGITKTQEELNRLKQAEELRKQRETENIERIKRLDAIIAGSYAKGVSGENILREIFKQFPKEMIATNFMVGGKVVEFGLVLPNKKIIPIDSKWTASKLVLELEKDRSPEEKEKIIEEIEKEVIKRIKEVKQYIDPSTTWSQAIVAVPDSVYAVCRKPHIEAQKTDIILMPYSMTLPLLLYMYRLHIQYAQSVDLENLQSHLNNISKNLNEMESILENQIARGGTMITNAYTTYKQIMSRIKSSLTEIQLKTPKEKKKLQKPK